MPADVFVYGTLLVPDMMQAVTGRHHACQPAVATGYARYYVKGRVYPGIVAEAPCSVTGVVYRNVSEDAVARLDFFEGPEYVRKQIAVLVEDRETLLAEAYVVPPAQRSLLGDQPWSIEEFRDHHLAEFLHSARIAMREYVPGGRVER